MYIHPDDFQAGFGFFRYCFEIWTVGYKKWGKENYSATFVKDPTVPRGLIMFCPRGERAESVPIAIPQRFYRVRTPDKKEPAP